MEKVGGDAQGVEILKGLATANPEYMRFLLTEVRTNTDHAATFKSKDGDGYRLTLELATGHLVVTKAAP